MSKLALSNDKDAFVELVTVMVGGVDADPDVRDNIARTIRMMMKDKEVALADISAIEIADYIQDGLGYQACRTGFSALRARNEEGVNPLAGGPAALSASVCALGDLATILLAAGVNVADTKAWLFQVVDTVVDDTVTQAVRKVK